MKIRNLVAFAAILALCACKSEAETSVTVCGIPEGANVVAIDLATSDELASVEMASESTVLTVKGEKNLLFAVRSEESEFQPVFFNDGVDASVNFETKEVEGSELNGEVASISAEMDALTEELTAAIQAYYALPDDQKEAAADGVQDKIDNVVAMFSNILAENGDSLIPAAFIENIFQVVESDELEEAFEKGGPWTKHPLTVKVKAENDEQEAERKADEEAKNAVVGEQFKDLEEPDVDGNVHKLSEYVGTGKWVLVDFWASWCGPCKKEMPNVVEAYQKFHDKGFDIVGLSFDNDKEKWVAAIGEWEMPWIHLSDLQGWKSVPVEVYGVNAIPDNLLIDPEGKIVARGLRGKKLVEKLEEVIK